MGAGPCWETPQHLPQYFTLWFQQLNTSFASLGLGWFGVKQLEHTDRKMLQMAPGPDLHLVGEVLEQVISTSEASSPFVQMMPETLVSPKGTECWLTLVRSYPKLGKAKPWGWCE